MIAPFDHPWLGGLFGDEAAQAIWSPDAQLAHMLAFEAAWSIALGDNRLAPMDAAEGAAADIGAFSVDMASLRTGTARDGVPVPDLVRQLKASSTHADAIHKGATSQDVIDTALALTLKATTDLLLARIGGLDNALRRLEAEFGANALMGRTRMQAALPITVADRVETWRLPLADHRERLEALRSRVERVQIGGPVGDRKALGDAADRMVAALADGLGLATAPKAWHAMRDGIADYASCLSLITGTLGKMGQDVCLMAQQGLDEIATAGGGGSSAMAHKNNPVLAELLVTLARFNAVQLSGMHHALVHEQERSGTAWALEWMILPQMCVAAARSLLVATEVCHTITRMGEPS